jgi:hypothetical protein
MGTVAFESRVFLYETFKQDVYAPRYCCVEAQI